MPSYSPVPERARAYGLTPRELEALCLAAEGLNSKESGARMRISEATVRGHLAATARKLRARNTTHAVAMAIELQVITSDPR